MNTLTKDQIQKLTPEQQADVAVLELERARVRQRLLEQARSRRGETIVAVLLPAFVMTPLMLLGSFRSSFIGSLLLVMSIGAVFVGTGIQINLINRRIDALIRLLEHELQDPVLSAKSGDKRALQIAKTVVPNLRIAGRTEDLHTTVPPQSL